VSLQPANINKTLIQMNRLVNQILKTVLSELFVDALKDTIHLSFGDDLFSSSKIHLNNLTFRSDIFDSCLYPFKLLSGYLGHLNIDGLAEFALGSSIHITLDNIFLLFTLPTPDGSGSGGGGGPGGGGQSFNHPFHIQILKKILLEMITNSFSYQRIKMMIKKVLDLIPTEGDQRSSGVGHETTTPTPILRQRKLISSVMKYFFKIILITIKKIHIRIEFLPIGSRTKDLHGQQGVPSSSSSSSSYCALGIILPSLKIGQNLIFTSTMLRAEMNAGNDEQDPQIALLLKSLQVCSSDHLATISLNCLS
jgi:hypothetical protein